MAKDKWLRLARLLEAASKFSTAEEVARYLDRECAGDDEERREVEELIKTLRERPGLGEPPKLVDPTYVGRRFDGLVIIEKIGTGGMGVVYRARQVALGRDVAVKILPNLLRMSDAIAERFRREAIAASKLDHPGIATVLTYGEVDETLYYVMELIEGPNLRDAMDKAWGGSEEPICRALRDQHRVARLVLQIAEALEFAHERGVVHRDIKPSNILLDAAGAPHIIDFGIAKLNDFLSITLTGELTGTLQYMSPEQAGTIEEVVDRRTDVYSLGAVLYELITQRPPIEGLTRPEILQKLGRVVPPRPSKLVEGIAENLETICMKALEQRPSDRYPSAASMASDLACFLRGDPILAKPPTPFERLTRAAVRRRSVLQATAAGIGVGAVAMGLWGLSRAIAKQRTRVRVSLVGGAAASFDVRPWDGRIGTFGEVTDSGSFEGSRTFDLDGGDYRLALRDDSGRTAEVLLAQIGRGEPTDLFVRLTDSAGETEMQRVDTTGTVAGVVQTEDYRGGIAAHGVPTPYAFRTAVEPFLVDRGCVTNGEYRAFLVDAGRWPDPSWTEGVRSAWTHPPTGWDDLPAVLVSWSDAAAYAAFRGKRLPTAAEYVAYTFGHDVQWFADAFARSPGDFNLGVMTSKAAQEVFSFSGYMRLARPAYSGPEQGPARLHHVIGNVDTWTESPGAAHVARNGEYVFSWHTRVISQHSYLNDHEAIIANGTQCLRPQPINAPHVTLGIRCVKSLSNRP